MKIRVLGCHGSEFGKHHSCGILINQSVMVDAGTICASLTMAEMKKINYILISHLHADHVRGIPAFSEVLISEDRKKPVEIIGVREVLEGLRRYLFNDQLWPDFTKLPTPDNPVLRLREIQEGETLKIDELEVRAFNVNHVIPCTGFIVREKGSSILFSGDTYQTENLWKAAGGDETLKAAIIEASFPNELEELAVTSKHLTPRLLLEEFKKIGKPDLPLYIYHMKPMYLEKIKREIKALKIKVITVLNDGKRLEI